MQNELQSEYMEQNIVRAENRFAQFGNARPPGPPLQPPGGGGTFDGMLEARVASLEADVKNIRESVGDMKGVLKDAQKDLTELKVSQATLNERVSHLPTKSYIGFWISGGLTATVAVLTVLSRLGFLVANIPK